VKVARLYDSSDIRFEEEPIPHVGPGEALVRTRACGICSGDIMGWYMKKKAPLVFGHEPAGEVVAVGAEVTNFRPGDRIFVHHHAPGGMAEYFLVPAENLSGDTLHLSDRCSFEDGSLIEPTACVVKSLRRSGLQPGERILIIGLGIMGQLHVALARHAGAETVMAADFVPYRREKAIELGADVVFDPTQGSIEEVVRTHTKGGMAEVVIVGPGSIEAMELGIRCAARGGTVVFFTASPPEATLSLVPYHLYFNEIRLIPSYSCGPNDTREALQVIEAGVVNAEKFITHRFPFAEIHAAYRNAAQARDSLKTVVVFP